MVLPALKRTARRQAVVLALVLGAAVAAGWALQQRELGRSSLRLPVGELRSNAAEYARLVEAAERQRLSAHFRRVHVAHLADRVDSARTELAGMRLPPALRDARSEAGALATELSGLLHREPTLADAAAAFVLAQRLGDIEARI
jgi:hypothetical protein